MNALLYSPIQLEAMALCGPAGLGGLLYDHLGTRTLDHLAPQPLLDAPLPDLVCARTPNGATEKAKNRGIAQRQESPSTVTANADAESEYAN